MAQPAPNMIILYVASAPASEAFYSKVLGLKAVESSPGFAMFALENGMMLGLWTKADVQPAASAPGGVEIGFPVKDNAALDALHGEWKAAGLNILQAPVQMDFGYTFTAQDPDGHRLRAFHAPM
ncbi:MAG: VOC family protein [Proteobacteria bacterium]|nr:VOC family protein [Pseudomonadota bacterium]